MRIPAPALPSIRGVATVPVGPSRALQREALDAADAREADTYDLLLRVGGVVAGVLHQVYGWPVPLAIQFAQAGRDYAGVGEARADDVAAKINPIFNRHSIATGKDSPLTKSYLTGRRWKKVGGDLTTLLGTLMSFNPANLHVNVAGVAYHGHAAALTAMHLTGLQALTARHADAAELVDWVRVVQVAKGLKLTIRGGLVVGAVIPAGSLPASIAAAAAITGISLTMAGACYAAAAKLHWLAYLEQNPQMASSLGGAGGPARRTAAAVGPGPNTNFSRPFPQPAAPVRNFSRPFQQPAPVPARGTGHAAAVPGRTASGATDVLQELFAKRGATRLLGSYDVGGIIGEPAGWLAVADKILLI